VFLPGLFYDHPLVLAPNKNFRLFPNHPETHTGPVPDLAIDLIVDLVLDPPPDSLPAPIIAHRVPP
jgi:hypothetical protein